MFNPFIKPQVPEITAEAVHAAIEAKENVIILDVRTQGEYTKGHIQKSIHIPLDDVWKNVPSVIPDKTATVYVYCLSGSRSVHAVKQMVHLGYTRVFNMTSGLLAWRQKGYVLTV